MVANQSPGFKQLQPMRLLRYAPPASPERERWRAGRNDSTGNFLRNHHFWTAKLAVMGKTGIHVFSRSLRYRNQTVRLPDGSNFTFLPGQEKGIDVRLALDTVRLARQNAYDVALVFSQDQDLTEAVEEIKEIAVAQNRWIKVVTAYPLSPTSHNRRGIGKTDWLYIDRAIYDSCIDPRDYRPKRE